MQVSKLIRFFLHPTTFLCLAVLIIFGSGRYQPILEEIRDPLGFLLGIIAGVLLYYGALVLTSCRLFSVSDYLKEIKKCFVDKRPSVRRIFILSGRAVYEEAFWRGTLQVLLGANVPTLLLTAFLFTLRHVYLYRNMRCLTTLLILEFSIFSILLGVLYGLTGRLTIVIGIHLVRNLLVSAKCSFPQRETALLHWPGSKSDDLILGGYLGNGEDI